MEVKLLFGGKKTVTLEELAVFNNDQYPLTAFDSLTVSFFDNLSKKILANSEINRSPEMVALAFWIRKTNLNKIKEENFFLFGNKNFITSPLGKVFHICPANVDTMFIYSLAVSVLMGNKNVLRISDRMSGSQIQVLFQILHELLSDERFELFNEYICLISYGHDAAINSFISKRSNARVIWGGDQTISTFRSFIPGPRTRDIVFADRVSASVINCSSYLSLNNNEEEQFSNKLFNDTYTFDQKGCSSPQSIYFIGDKKHFDECINRISRSLSNISEQKYATDIASLASLKMNQKVDDVLLNSVTKIAGDNYASFAVVSNESGATDLHSCGGGYFYGLQIDTIKQLKNFITSKSQTVTYFGLTEQQLSELKLMAQGEGIDRIVPLGSALDFHYIWDGYNLLEALSRKVYIK